MADVFYHNHSFKIAYKLRALVITANRQGGLDMAR